MHVMKFIKTTTFQRYSPTQPPKWRRGQVGENSGNGILQFLFYCLLPHYAYAHVNKTGLHRTPFITIFFKSTYELLFTDATTTTISNYM